MRATGSLGPFLSPANAVPVIACALLLDFTSFCLPAFSCCCLPLPVRRPLGSGSSAYSLPSFLTLVTVLLFVLPPAVFYYSLWPPYFFDSQVPQYFYLLPIQNLFSLFFLALSNECTIHCTFSTSPTSLGDWECCYGQYRFVLCLISLA